MFHVDVGPFQEEFYQCVTYGTYTAEWQEHLYATFTILLMFIIPLVILAATYLLTVCTLQRKFLKYYYLYIYYCVVFNEENHLTTSFNKFIFTYNNE